MWECCVQVRADKKSIENAFALGIVSGKPCSDNGDKGAPFSIHRGWMVVLEGEKIISVQEMSGPTAKMKNVAHLQGNPATADEQIVKSESSEIAATIAKQNYAVQSNEEKDLATPSASNSDSSAPQTPSVTAVASRAGSNVSSQ